MRRRLLTTFFVFVFLGSSVAAFGPWGMALAGYLLGIPGGIWLWRRGRAILGDFLLAAVIGLPVSLLIYACLQGPPGELGPLVFLVAAYCSSVFGTIRLWRSGMSGVAAAATIALIAVLLGAVLLPAVGAAREAGRRPQCANNLKQIALALLNYEHQNRCFPPAYVCDKEGKPAHSWRVLILPYVECMGLYRKYDFNEPWNGANNRLLGANMPPGYICPGGYAEGANRPQMASYVVVTGAGTAFPGRETRKLDDIMDEKRDTILVVEVANSDIHWMEPRDASLEDLTASRGGSCQPLSSHHDAGSDYWHYFQPDGGNVVSADNSVHCLPGRIRPEDVRAIVSISGGEGVRIDDLAEKHLIAGLRWDHVIGLPLFCLSFVALLCLALTTRRRHQPPVAEPLAVE